MKDFKEELLETRDGDSEHNDADEKAGLTTF